MADKMCGICFKRGEPGCECPSCDKAECPFAERDKRRTAFFAQLTTDPRETEFNMLTEAAARAGVMPTMLDWFKAGTHYRAREIADSAVTRGVLGTGSAAGHTTAEFSSLSNQAHGYGVPGMAATWEHRCTKRPPSAPNTVLPQTDSCPACGAAPYAHGVKGGA